MREKNCVDELNWVKVRSECTPDKVFEKIREAAVKDLDEWKSINPKRAETIELSKVSHGFRVGTTERDIFSHHAVLYHLKVKNGEHRIEVKRIVGKQEEARLIFRVCFSVDGECIIHKYDDKDSVMSIWQLNRLALEGLFFD